MFILKRAALILVMIFTPFSAVTAQGFDVNAKQAIVIDYETGTVLYEKNADEQMPTSSMSKVMTMYLVFEALQKGNIKLDDTFNVSEKAWSKKGSKMFVELGNDIKIEDLVRGVIVQSGNDATIVLAEGLAGTEEAFAQALNNKAKELGMNNSQFMNASGWPDPDHYSTARDLATMARAIIKNFPEYYKYYGEKEFTYHDIRQSNRNPLVLKGVGDGLKTGHTEDGGYGLIGTGKEDGRRVIFVLNGMESKNVRSEESVKVLNWALKSFKTVKLFTKNEVLDEVPVYLGNKNSVKVTAQKEVVALVQNLQENDIKIEIEYAAPIKAPVSKGVELGVVKIHLPNIEAPLEQKLIAAENVSAMNGILKYIQKARMLTSGEGQLAYD